MSIPLNQLTTTEYSLQRVQRLGNALIPCQPRPQAYQQAIQTELPTPSPLPKALNHNTFIHFKPSAQDLNRVPYQRA